MTAKEKAKNLIDKYQKDKIITFQRSAFSPIEEFELTDNEAKYCALICVDEILKVNNNIFLDSDRHRYWKEVKQELEKL